jgi:hypothetical protein
MEPAVWVRVCVCVSGCGCGLLVLVGWGGGGGCECGSSSSGSSNSSGSSSSSGGSSSRPQNKNDLGPPPPPSRAAGAPPPADVHGPGTSRRDGRWAGGRWTERPRAHSGRCLYLEHPKSQMPNGPWARKRKPRCDTWHSHGDITKPLVLISWRLQLGMCLYYLLQPPPVFEADLNHSPRAGAFEMASRRPPRCHREEGRANIAPQNIGLSSFKRALQWTPNTILVHHLWPGAGAWSLSC